MAAYLACLRISPTWVAPFDSWIACSILRNAGKPIASRTMAIPSTNVSSNKLIPDWRLTAPKSFTLFFFRDTLLPPSHEAQLSSLYVRDTQASKIPCPQIAAIFLAIISCLYSSDQRSKRAGRMAALAVCNYFLSLAALPPTSANLLSSAALVKKSGGSGGFNWQPS